MISMARCTLRLFICYTIHAGTEIQALAFYTETSQTYRAELSKGITAALTKRDEVFGDYRSSEGKSDSKKD